MRYFWNNVSGNLKTAHNVHEVLDLKMEGYSEVNEDKYAELRHEGGRNAMRASGILAIAYELRRDGTSYTAEALRQFAQTDGRLEFDQESGELRFDGIFYAAEFARLRERLREAA